MPAAAVGTARYMRRDSGLLARASFNVRDGATVLPRCETGQQWSTFGSGGGTATWGTTGGQAYLAAVSGGTDYGAWIDTGLRAGFVEATITLVSGTGANVGLLVRYQDDQNYVGVRLAQASNQAQILQNVAGSRSAVNMGAVTLATGVPYRLAVFFMGPRIVCLVNGAQVGVTTSTNFPGATKQGLLNSSGASTARTWDDYLMRAA